MDYSLLSPPGSMSIEPDPTIAVLVHAGFTYVCMMEIIWMERGKEPMNVAHPPGAPLEIAVPNPGYRAGVRSRNRKAGEIAGSAGGTIHVQNALSDAADGEIGRAHV